MRSDAAAGERRDHVQPRPPSPPGLPGQDRCLVMGVVNVTPDSFSDGGQWFGPEAAIAHGLELAAQGADIVDVGGGSTRPGAQRTTADEELRRGGPGIFRSEEHTSELHT